jgi:quercetin dioxygenase-like cupin family protein
MSTGVAAAQTTSAPAPTIVMPDAVKWMPGTGMMKGAEVAVLQGDPTKSGPYVIRVRIPANTTLAPHYHGEAENVTVISGALLVGLGDKVDTTKMQELGPGAFASLPANVHHYALTKVPTVIQINGMGPESMMAAGKM